MILIQHILLKLEPAISLMVKMNYVFKKKLIVDEFVRNIYINMGCCESREVSAI
jgi:hypothetical protein